MITPGSQYLDEQINTVKENGFLRYRTGELPTWCPGCGYFGITDAILKACLELNLKNEEICAISGIGCAGRYPVFMNVYGFHTLHGRSIPVASGVKLAREDLTVFAVAGDGDALGIGGGHLPHIARKNIDITLFLFDNSIYGLTKGQSSATTLFGQATSSHPGGNPDTPLNPIKLALAYGASFVARGFAGDPEGLKHLAKEAITHKGFSFLHITTPCVTFDKFNFTWKNLKENHSYIDQSIHNVTDMESAMRIAEHERFKLGVFYKDSNRLSYHENLRNIASKKA
ncbi:MAG: 2-oxoacid:ferredoxin oxidoreductase subunit beta [Proteobacteria bacterium]|nr:2-oxoacid:ferredoxin oxidoreductase subunit beta [Pseudomonadota bacterium]